MKSGNKVLRENGGKKAVAVPFCFFRNPFCFWESILFFDIHFVFWASILEFSGVRLGVMGLGRMLGAGEEYVGRGKSR